MNREWTTDMKQKLEGHKKTPPAGLWESISSEMGLQNEPAPKTVAIRRWYWAVAAVVLALVGFFAVYQFDQNEPLPQVAQATYTTEAPQEPESPIINKKVMPDNQQQALVTKPVQQVTEEPVQQETSDEMIQQEVAEEQPQQEVAEESPKQTAMVANRLAHSETDYHTTAHYQTKQMVTSDADDKWTIGLNASGGLLASSNQSRTNRIYDQAPFANDIQANDAVPKVDNSTYMPSFTRTNIVSKHHLPVSLGLSLHYQLNPRLALLSGVNYTYLYSEFSIPLYPNIHETQKLHYLGIPVGLSYQLWKTNGFSLYLSGAAQFEKCLNEKPWQFSVSAAAGAEYAITSQFGLYLEPSLGYYFDDGTSFEHYYKEHPLAPSIEFGLRLHFSGK